MFAGLKFPQPKDKLNLSKKAEGGHGFIHCMHKWLLVAIHGAESLCAWVTVLWSKNKKCFYHSLVKN